MNYALTVFQLSGNCKLRRSGSYPLCALSVDGPGMHKCNLSIIVKDPMIVAIEKKPVLSSHWQETLKN